MLKLKCTKIYSHIQSSDQMAWRSCPALEHKGASEISVSVKWWQNKWHIFISFYYFFVRHLQVRFLFYPISASHHFFVVFLFCVKWILHRFSGSLYNFVKVWHQIFVCESYWQKWNILKGKNQQFTLPLVRRAEPNSESFHRVWRGADPGTIRIQSIQLRRWRTQCRNQQRPSWSFSWAMFSPLDRAEFSSFVMIKNDSKSVSNRGFDYLIVEAGGHDNNQHGGNGGTC